MCEREPDLERHAVVGGSLVLAAVVLAVVHVHVVQLQEAHQVSGSLPGTHTHARQDTHPEICAYTD